MLPVGHLNERLFCNPTFLLNWNEENDNLIDQKWLQALLNDDSEAVENILDKLEDAEKVVLLHSSIWEPPSEKRFKVKDMCVNLYKDSFKVPPFAIACISGSYDVIKVLMCHNVHLCHKDDNRNNVLHSMVYAAAFVPELIEKMKEVYEYLQMHLSIDNLRTLLMSENAEGYRPLELATLLETYPLFLAYMETDGVYLVHRERYGVCQMRWYDVTDYELPGEGNRCLKSPIRCLLTQSHKTLEAKATHAVFSSGIIKTWSTAKLKCVLPFLAFWVLLRVLFIASFVFYDLTQPLDTNLPRTAVINGTLVYGNKVNCPAHVFLVSASSRELHGLLLIAYACVALLLNGTLFTKWIIQKWASRGLACTLLRRKKCVQAWHLYTLANIFASGGVLVRLAFDIALRYHAAELSQTKQDTLVLGGQVVYAMTYVSVIWGLLFFLQFLPVIGHVIIAIQHMVFELAKFSVALILFLLAFTIIFDRLIYPGHGVGCPEEFSSFSRALYTTMVATINSIDFSSFQGNHKQGTLIMHVVFIFLVGILLINFLIALFSNILTTVYNNKLVVESVQRLSMVVALDRVTNWFSKYKMFIMRKHFTVRDGRVYFATVQVDVKS